MCISVTNRVLIGHIISKDGITMDPDKVKAILLTPSNAKDLCCFLGQIHWHNWMMHFLANFATLLLRAYTKYPIHGQKMENQAFESLNILLSHDLMVQPLD